MKEIKISLGVIATMAVVDGAAGALAITDLMLWSARGNRVTP